MTTGQNDAEKFLNAQLRDKGAALTAADISHISDLAATLNELLPLMPVDNENENCYYNCPVCDGEGTIDLDQVGHCRTAGAAGIQVYGCGIEHVKLAELLNESGPKLAALCEMARQAEEWKENAIGLEQTGAALIVKVDNALREIAKLKAERDGLADLDGVDAEAESLKSQIDKNDQITMDVMRERDEAREEIAKLRDMRDQDSKELSDQCTVSYLQGRASRNDEVRAKDEEIAKLKVELQTTTDDLRNVACYLSMACRERDEARARVAPPIIDQMRAIARELGWALGVHGTLVRDIDLIAVPWTAEAAPWTAVYDAWLAKLPLKDMEGALLDIPGGIRNRPPGMPFNRKSILILQAGTVRVEDGNPKGTWDPPALDVSFMVPPEKAKGAGDEGGG